MLVAVDGRGASRGGRLIGSLAGGSAPSGIERWIVTGGGKPEDVSLDVSLRVISAPTGNGYCWFGLTGTLIITTR